MTVFQNPHALETAYLVTQVLAVAAFLYIIYKVVEVSTEPERANEEKEKCQEEKD